MLGRMKPILRLGLWKPCHRNDGSHPCGHLSSAGLMLHLACMSKVIPEGGLCHLLAEWPSWTSPSHLISLYLGAPILKRWELWYKFYKDAAEITR